MKRKLRTNKKFGKKNGKRGSKKVYKKRNSKSLRKTTKRGRRGSRKMRGGADDLFDTTESTIPVAQEDIHELDTDTSLSLDETTGEGHTTSETGTGTTNSFSNVASNLQGNSSNISAISNATSDGTMTVGELDLSNASSASGVTDRPDMSTSFGGKRRKGKKTQKRRRGKKGGELPFDYNPNDRDPDADHN
jgi:hypothetical protein